jgi:hypothetical protein
VRKQSLLEISIGEAKVDQVVLLSTQLLTEAILGLDFLINYEAEISFPKREITLKINEITHKLGFLGVEDAAEDTVKAQDMSENHYQEFRLMSVLAQNPPPQTADREAGHLHHMEEGSTASRDSLVESRGSEASIGMRNGECLYI